MPTIGKLMRNDICREEAVLSTEEWQDGLIIRDQKRRLFMSWIFIAAATITGIVTIVCFAGGGIDGIIIGFFLLTLTLWMVAKSYGEELIAHYVRDHKRVSGRGPGLTSERHKSADVVEFPKGA